MFLHQGIYLPDGEKHFPEWMTNNGEIVDGKGTYQIKKFRAAMEHCKQFRVAVDVGAHVGLWTMQLAKRFRHVLAFEPVFAYRQCWLRNVDGIEAITLPVDIYQSRAVVLYPFALGALRVYTGTLAEGPRAHVNMVIPALGSGIDSGGTYVADEEPDEFDTEAIPMYALDEFELKNVDFIKIDVEGFEDEVLAGARETISRCRPTIIVEQKPHKLGPNFGKKGTPAVDLLKGMGAKVVREMSGDWIMRWDD